MEENIAWIQALTRNKDFAEGKIATIDNEIMDINLDSLFLDSDSRAGISCIDFWACRQATQIQREDSVGLIYLSEIRKTGVLGFDIKRWFTNTILSTN